MRAYPLLLGSRAKPCRHESIKQHHHGQELVRAYPLLLGCDAASAGAVVACLADAGLTRAELERMLLGWPKVLLMECAPAPPPPN